MLLSGGDVCGQQIRHAITAERPPARVGKHRRFRAPLLFTLPRASRGDRVFAQGDTPYFPTFAVTAYMRPRAQGDVLPAEPDQLRDAQPVWIATRSRVRSRRPAHVC